MESKLVKNQKDINDIELLRKEVFKLKETSNYYLNDLLNRKEFAIGTYDNNIIVGGLYFHRFEKTLMIDQVFVKEEYQNRKIGTNLITMLWAHKRELELILGGPIEMCKIESQNEKSHSLYNRIGFRETKFDDDMLFKRM